MDESDGNHKPKHKDGTLKKFLSLRKIDKKKKKSEKDQQLQVQRVSEANLGQSDNNNSTVDTKDGPQTQQPSLDLLQQKEIASNPETTHDNSPAKKKRDVPERNQVRISENLVEEVRAWENKKLEYLNQVQPLLAQKSQELDKLFEDYMEQLKSIITKQGIRDDLIRIMLEDESRKLRNTKDTLFGKDNSTIKFIDKEINMRKNVVQLESSIVKLQALWRGRVIRKKYGKILKRNHHRNLLVKEILETERFYVSNLDTIVKVFVIPLQDHITHGSPILSQNMINLIFSNVQLILNVNRELLKNLEDRYKIWKSQSTIGDIFMRLAPFLKLYVQYVNNYNASVANLELQTQENQAFAAFLQKTLQNPGVVKMGQKGLANFQILPVQRIPRYEMLLKDLVKYTDEDHPDFKNLCEALFKIKEVAQTINERKRIAESMSKVIEIQKMLGLQDLVTPSRRVVKEGTVLCESKKKGGRRSTVSNMMGGTIRSALGIADLSPVHIFLFNDMIIFAKKKLLTSLGIGEEYKFRVKQQFPMADVTCEPLEIPSTSDNNSKLYGFLLVANKGREQHAFYCEKKEEGEGWYNLIQSTSSEFYQQLNSLKIDPAEREDSSDSFAQLISKLPAVPVEGTSPHQARNTSSFYNFPATPPSKPHSAASTPPMSPAPNHEYHTPPQNVVKVSVNDRPMSATYQPQVINIMDMAIPKQPPKLRQVIKLLEKLLALRQNMIAPATQLQKVIPQAVEVLSPAETIQFYNTIQDLKKVVDDMLAYNENVEQLLKKEKLFSQLNTVIKEGQDHISGMRLWVSETFPKSSQEPTAVKARSFMAYVMQWYINLIDLYDMLLDYELS